MWRVTLRGDFAGHADIVVIAHRATCATARRVAMRAASLPTRFGAPTPAPAVSTCIASFLRHSVTCQHGRDRSNIDHPAVAIALPDSPAGRCGDVRVNRLLQADRRGTFGAFGITGTCTPHPTATAQQVRVNCRVGDASVTFVDKVPNG